MMCSSMRAAASMPAVVEPCAPATVDACAVDDARDALTLAHVASAGSERARFPSRPALTKHAAIGGLLSCAWCGSRSISKSLGTEDVDALRLEAKGIFNTETTTREGRGGARTARG